MQLTNWELIEMNWLTFCESSPWLFGSCDKVLQCEFGNWANCLNEQTFVWLFWFLESFYLRPRTFDFKLKTKITGVPGVWWWIKHHDGCWRVVFYRKPQSKYGCFVYAFCSFLTVTKIYDYILNIWTDSLWKCQMLVGKKGILPSNMRSRYNHESLVSGSVK